MDRREYSRSYYLKNRERIISVVKAHSSTLKAKKEKAVYDREYLKKNRLRIRNRISDWWKKREESGGIGKKEEGRLYYSLNKERLKQYHQSYYQCNGDKVRASTRAYQIKNRKLLSQKSVERYHSDLEFRLKRCLRIRLSKTEIKRRTTGSRTSILCWS